MSPVGPLFARLIEDPSAACPDRRRWCSPGRRDCRWKVPAEAGAALGVGEEVGEPGAGERLFLGAWPWSPLLTQSPIQSLFQSLGVGSAAVEESGSVSRRQILCRRLHHRGNGGWAGCTPPAPVLPPQPPTVRCGNGKKGGRGGKKGGKRGCRGRGGKTRNKGRKSNRYSAASAAADSSTGANAVSSVRGSDFDAVFEEDLSRARPETVQGEIQPATEEPLPIEEGFEICDSACAKAVRWRDPKPVRMKSRNVRNVIAGIGDT